MKLNKVSKEEPVVRTNFDRNRMFKGKEKPAEEDIEEESEEDFE